MIKPAIPSNESQRLQTLRDLKLLDTPPEERFDRVTRLAKQVFGTPIALVSLVDADRQWFKSRQGLDATETPRDISFCGHAILDDKIMVVNDAESDQRFCDNPLVCGNPNIRFYAGYPLAAPDGNRIGTLCIIDEKPREMSHEQLQLLRELGRMVEEELIAANDATVDPVTRLSNRNGFLTIADHLLPLCKRTDEPASLMLFHMHHLESLEERHGRYEGDTEALSLAHLLLASFRESDIIARVSLDTFCVLLVDSDLDASEGVRLRFDMQLSQRNRDSSNKHQMLVEINAIAYNKDEHENAESLLRDAEIQFVESQKQRHAEIMTNAGRKSRHSSS